MGSYILYFVYVFKFVDLLIKNKCILLFRERWGYVSFLVLVGEIRRFLKVYFYNIVFL